MQTIYREITKEEFNKFKDRPKGYTEFVNEKAGMSIVWGYGLYGSRFVDLSKKTVSF